MSEALVPAVTGPPVARTGPAAMALPAVIVDAGPVAVERFLEFFAASIANGRTRAAYGRAVGRFLSWCAARGLGLRGIAPLHVAAYIRTHPGSAPTVKQHLAAIRVLCDWLVVHQVLPVNPAAAVRGPKHVVTKGATPVLTPAETRSLLDGIDPGSLVGLRDRALLSVMVYSFARVSAVVGMRRQDYFWQGVRGWLRLHEKGGKRHDVPAHHRAAAAVDAYLVAGGVEDAKAPLFQSVDRSGRLSGRSLTRRVVLAMIKRRAAAAGLPSSTCCHTFRATGITAYLSNGGTLEHAQQIAGHASPRTTKLYDRTADNGHARRDRTHRDLTGGERARPGWARPSVTLLSPALLGSSVARSSFCAFQPYPRPWLVIPPSSSTVRPDAGRDRTHLVHGVARRSACRSRGTDGFRPVRIGRIRGERREVLITVDGSPLGWRSRRWTAGRWTPATSSAGWSRLGRRTSCAWWRRSVERAAAAGGRICRRCLRSGGRRWRGSVWAIRRSSQSTCGCRLPAMCPDCGADVLASADINGDAQLQLPFNL